MRFALRRLVLPALLVTLILVDFAACGGSSRTPAPIAQSSGSPPRLLTLPHRLAVRLPAGWHLLRKPITEVTYPVQVLAATSYLVRPGRPGGNCTPRPVLSQKPPDGVLLEVVEWTKRSDQPNLGDFPGRRRPFRLPNRAFSASYECAGGPSYNVPFRDHRRAFQAFTWLNPKRIDPRVRRQAIDLLSSLRFKALRAR
jgi:hypothetical protein